MSESALAWLVRAALGGGLVLFVAWWRAHKIESPARRQRLAEGALASALLVALLGLAPHWICVRLPAWEAAPPAAAVTEPAAASPDVEPFDLSVVGFEPFDEMPAEPALPDTAPPEPDPRPVFNWDVAAGLIVSAYALVASALLAWWLAGHAVLWWMLRRRGAVPARLAGLWAELAAGRRSRLLVSPRVRVPFSCGLLRPTVVIPAGLANAASMPELRWVLRHELRHLERGDPLSAWLFGIGQSVFFYLPWFWWLRREVRLCQEYLADQAAVGAGGDRVEYADFLAGWASAPGLPAGVSAVTGQGSDLLRRVRMLLDKHVLESRCPRGWLLGVLGGLLAAAVLLAGVGPAAMADDKPVPFSADNFDAFAEGDAKKDDKKPEKDKDTKKDDKDKKKEDKEKPKDKPRMSLLDVDELLKRLPADLNEEQVKMIKQQLEAAKRQMEQAVRAADAFKNEQLWMANRRWQPDELLGRVGVRKDPAEARLGARFSAPSATLAEQLDLPKNQGLVVDLVHKDSPAAKVGLRPNDVLLEVNGKPVANTPQGMAKQLESLEANKAVDVTVLRKGKKETLKGLTLPEAAKAERSGEQGGSMLTLSRTGDQFTVLSREGGKMINVRGKLSDGKAQLTSVQINQGRQSVAFASLDKVPKESQEEVKALLALAEKSAVGAKAKPANPGQ